MLLFDTEDDEVGGAKAEEEEVADWMLVAMGDGASVIAEVWQVRPSEESLAAGALLFSLNTWLRLFALELTRDESATRDDGPGSRVFLEPSENLSSLLWEASLDCMSVAAWT